MFGNWRQIFSSSDFQTCCSFQTGVLEILSSGFQKVMKLETGFHIKVDGCFLMKPIAKTVVHTYSDAGFQFMYHLRTCVLIDLEGGSHLKPKIKAGVYKKTDAAFLSFRNSGVPEVWHGSWGMYLVFMVSQQCLWAINWVFIVGMFARMVLSTSQPWVTILVMWCWSSAN